MKKIVVVALAVLLSHSVAFAGVVSDVLNVTAQIGVGAGECTVSTNPLDFGISDGATPVDSEGSITIQCPASLPYSIALDAGLLFDGLRSLQGPHQIAYFLFTPNLDEWGDDGITYPAPSLSGVGSGAPETLPVIGTLDPGFYGPAPDGIYSDVVNVTVIY